MFSDQLGLSQQTTCQMVRRRKVVDKLNKALGGKFEVEHIRNGKVIKVYNFNNDITNEGKNLILNTMFVSGTQTATAGWVVGLISNTSYSALAAGDTMAAHAGWQEFTGYSQATRVAWGQSTSTAQSVTNASPVTFDINANGTVKGVFVTNQNTKGGTTGNLWATALFNADVPVTNGDQLRVTYTVNA
jgi:hypothetical protein